MTCLRGALLLIRAAVWCRTAKAPLNWKVVKPRRVGFAERSAGVHVNGDPSRPGPHTPALRAAKPPRRGFTATFFGGAAKGARFCLFAVDFGSVSATICQKSNPR